MFFDTGSFSANVLLETESSRMYVKYDVLNGHAVWYRKGHH